LPVPQVRRDNLIEFALEHEALSPRELAAKCADELRYFISVSPANRILKVADLITAAGHVTIKAAAEIHDKTTSINQLWQTDFTCIKVIGWGWFDLSKILDDDNRARPLSSDQWRTRARYLMEIMYDHAGQRYDRHAGSGFASVWL
jgi:hypothetical protein